MEDPFVVAEWVVENLGSWHREVHGKSLRERQSGLELYPRGLDGDGERLVLRAPKPFAACAVSFVRRRDGSVVCETDLEPTNETGDYTSATGPKYEDVVDGQEKAAAHKDTLTLRCTSMKRFDKKYHGHTTLNVSDTLLKVPAGTLTDLKLGESKLISTIRYALNEEEYEMEISAYDNGACFSVVEPYHIRLKFISTSRSNNILIRSYISITSLGAVLKTEEKDFLALCDNEYIICSLTRNRIEAKGCEISLQIRIINGLTQKTCKISEPSVNCVSRKTSKNQNLFSFGQGNKSLDVLLQDLMSLYQDEEFSDFELRCGSITFPTHRSILIARSPVFKRMLSHNMSETASCSTDITDLDPHTLGRLLIFLYTGTVKDLSCKNALTLYYAADKYQIATLKEECSCILIHGVKVSNVCDILSLADKHQDEKLNSAVLKFILENYSDVLRSEEWGNYMEREPYLLLKTLTSISKKSNVGKIGINSIQTFVPSKAKGFTFGIGLPEQDRIAARSRKATNISE